MHNVSHFATKLNRMYDVDREKRTNGVSVFLFILVQIVQSNVVPCIEKNGTIFGLSFVSLSLFLSNFLLLKHFRPDFFFYYEHL